jgi:hypothetical protein
MVEISRWMRSIDSPPSLAKSRFHLFFQPHAHPPRRIGASKVLIVGCGVTEFGGSYRSAPDFKAAELKAVPT